MPSPLRHRLAVADVAAGALRARARAHGRSDIVPSGLAIIRDLTALWFQAPLVIAARTQAMMMAALTGSTGQYAEASRMVTEKIAAAAESAVAANMALAKESMTVAAALAGGRARTRADHKRVAGAALRPYARRVRANARRLKK